MSRELWEVEYRRHFISSSTNAQPSHGTELLRGRLAEIRAIPGPRRLLDLGCGAGRNAEMLGETGFDYYGMDFARGPLSLARARGGAGLRLLQASMAAPLPFTDGAFSLVTAFTSLENLVLDEQIRALAEEVHRVLCPHGAFFAYFVTTDDTYYRPLVTRQADGRSLTYDPATQLRQRVYTAPELRDLLAPWLELITSDAFVFQDTRSGGRYERRLAASLWRRVGVD